MSPTSPEFSLTLLYQSNRFLSSWIRTRVLFISLELNPEARLLSRFLSVRLARKDLAASRAAKVHSTPQTARDLPKSPLIRRQPTVLATDYLFVSPSLLDLSSLES